MARTALWHSIAQTLKTEISKGQYTAGDKLPTEAELATRFGVNRHTVRRALGGLTEDGITYSRRGAGVFVAQRPTDYPIGQRVRFHQNLISAGRAPMKRVLSLATRHSNQTEQKMLHLPAGSLVHAYEGLSLADDTPVALFLSVFPAERFPDLLDHLRQSSSVTKALHASGLEDFTRASTRLKAKLASATQSLHLKVSEGAPILHSIGVNVDTDGTPIEFGNTWFAGDRITLTFDR